MNRQNLIRILRSFLNPILILIGIFVYLGLKAGGYDQAGFILVLAIIALGSYELFLEIIQSLLRRQFALDYIAVAAIGVALYSNEFLVGAIIALMLSTGQHLEKYGTSQAKKTLTALVDRLPNQVTVLSANGESRKVKISEVKKGEHILVRKGEVIPLDGLLLSEAALTDESSLTGEPYLFEKFEGDLMRSGTVNLGDPVTIQVEKEEEESTYTKIIEMVQKAQSEKAPLIRLADRYSTFFTLVTTVICGVTFWFTRDLERVLAILVIATPCPLILGTPIALMGGMSACAKNRIIVKKLSSLEVLSRIDTVIFDKTGTITMGKPTLTEIEIKDPSYSREQILALVTGIERNSLHPLAKAIVETAKLENIQWHHAHNIREKIGHGITGEVDGETYHLVRDREAEGMAIEFLMGEMGQEKKIAAFHFEDEIKPDTVETLKAMKRWGLETFMFTGDKQKAAERTVEKLGLELRIKAECTPEDKQKGVEEFKKAGKVTAMVGDGINDAPALALADIGMVFSNEEQTASSEAADVVFLGGDFSLVAKSLTISRRTIRIALQSIILGIGLSIAGMLLAAFGLIVPMVGAILQELIDVGAILNALRAAKTERN